MENSQYHSNGLANPQYSSLPNISPHQLTNNGAPHLPPLQPQQHANMFQNGSAPQTPRTPGTPNTPAPAGNMNFSQQMQPRGYQQPMNNYQQQPNPYLPARSGSMMPQSSTSMSHPQNIAPAPPQNRMQQPLAPMPPNGMHMQNSMPYGNHMMQQPNMLDNMEPPTHVVGSQGRRGILPSAPGRPAVPVGAGTSKNAMIPAKDADGKFPCPHCTKTYLHAKHLKRHLLRHTGDRPYMCVLCRDTFSRSDILKRHFQKCSIRRGNPTGASHLSHAQAHLKKSHPGPHKGTPSMTNENEMMPINGMGNMGNMDPALQPFGVIADGSVPDAGSNMTDDQAAQEQLQQSNNLKRFSTDSGRNGGMTGPGPGSRSSFGPSYAGQMPPSMASGMNPPIAFNISGQNHHSYSQNNNYNYAGNGAPPPPSNNVLQSLPNGRTPIQVYSNTSASQQTPEWPQMFQSNPQDRFSGTYNPNSQLTIKPESSINNGAFIKQESTATNGHFAGVYPGVPTGVSDFTPWNLQNDPLQQISSRLIFLCFPPNSQFSSRNAELQKFLSPDNIKHFLDHFTSFQGHFPIIHMPTFRILDAYDGLLLGMICIGAVYSDRINPAQVRDLMDLSRMVVESNSDVYTKISHEIGRENGYASEIIGGSESELEQMTAIFLIHVLSTWHGNPFQREKARRQYPLIVALARKAGLTQPVTTPPFSALHQPNIAVEHFSASSFDWNAWIEQERRSRLMYAIFLIDAAMVIYFNVEPMFQMFEVRLPLPADDAAWDAGSAGACAEALGLHGATAAREKNPEGSRRPKQPEMHSALRALMHNVFDLQPGTTNLYSKFILVHALHVQLWSAQRQASQESSHAMPLATSGTSTPISQHDWIVRGIDPTGNGVSSANSSGRATPVEPSNLQSLPHQLLRTTNNAFDKWKKAWDEDMAMQYPPTTRSYRRFGFCRDGVHFYWLAKYLMQNPRALDWNMAPDQRFSQVMSLLTSVKTWVVSDSAKRGEELGSVSDVDKDYGITDLTLDMAQLFKPINKQIDSPIVGVHTNGVGL